MIRSIVLILLLLFIGCSSIPTPKKVGENGLLTTPELKTIVLKMPVKRFSKGYLKWNDIKNNIDDDNQKIDKTIDKTIDEFEKEKEKSLKEQKNVFIKTDKLVSSLGTIQNLFTKRNELISSNNRIVEMIHKQVIKVSAIIKDVNISINKIYLTKRIFGDGSTKKDIIEQSRKNIGSGIFSHYIRKTNDEISTSLKLNSIQCDDKKNGNKNLTYNIGYYLVQSFCKQKNDISIIVSDGEVLTYDLYDYDNGNQKMEILFNAKISHTNNVENSVPIDENIIEIPISKFEIDQEINSKTNIAINKIIVKLRALPKKGYNVYYNKMNMNIAILRKLLKRRENILSQYEKIIKDLQTPLENIKIGLGDLKTSCKEFIAVKEKEKEKLSKISATYIRKYPYLTGRTNDNLSADKISLRTLNDIEVEFKTYFNKNNYFKKVYSINDFNITKHDVSFTSTPNSIDIRARLHTEGNPARYSLGVVYYLNEHYQVSNLDNFDIPELDQCISSTYFNSKQESILSNLDDKLILKLEESIEGINNNNGYSSHIDYFSLDLLLLKNNSKKEFINSCKIGKYDGATKDEVYAKIFPHKPVIKDIQYKLCSDKVNSLFTKKNKLDSLLEVGHEVESTDNLGQKSEFCNTPYGEIYKEIFNTPYGESYKVVELDNKYRPECNNDTFNIYIESMKNLQFNIMKGLNNKDINSEQTTNKNDTNFLDGLF